jgi:hypothetical protein
MNYYFSNTQGQIERLTIVEKFENNINSNLNIPSDFRNIQSVTTAILNTLQPANSIKSGTTQAFTNITP